MAAKPREAAKTLRYARVLPLLMGVPHLDRPFDYQVPEHLSRSAQPGVRVRIKFRGKPVDGIILERANTTDFAGRLAWLEQVLSPVVVAPLPTLALVAALADRYAGTTADLLRLAVPARHTKVAEEQTVGNWAELAQTNEPDLSPWMNYVWGENFVDAVLAGKAPRAAWQIAPGDNWAAAIGALAVKVALTGGAVRIIVPDATAATAVTAACRQWVGAAQVETLTTTTGPQARYRIFLSCLSGRCRILVGTRSAAWFFLPQQALTVVMFDGDEHLVEQQAPYVHAREVCTTWVAQQGGALLIGGYARTAEVQQLVEYGFCHNLVPSRQTMRARSPLLQAVADSDFALARDPLARQLRIPGIAQEAIRAALTAGQPVLVSVPRKGYVPTISCQHCRTPARCKACHGPLAITAPGSVPCCSWCGRPDQQFVCPTCGGTKLRATVIGTARTSEEFGRAYPGVRIVTATAEQKVVAQLTGPAIVIATPGVEPEAKGGYGAAVLLDTWQDLGQADLRAQETTLAKWWRLASLVCPASRGGKVVVVAENSHPVTQAFLAWDPVTAAAKELGQRRQTRLPPAVYLAAIDGPADALAQFLPLLDLPKVHEILGPVDLPAGTIPPSGYDPTRHTTLQRLIIRTPLQPTLGLGKALRQAKKVRAAKQQALPLRVTLDPLQVG